jgi:hypothetical protein
VGQEPSGDVHAERRLNAGSSPLAVLVLALRSSLLRGDVDEGPRLITDLREWDGTQPLGGSTTVSDSCHFGSI